jgi:hypothetical protein
VTRKEWPPGGNSRGPEDDAPASATVAPILPHPADDAVTAKLSHLAGRYPELAAPCRFGQPSSYSLSRVELSRHIRKLRRSGWQSWEVAVRFDYWPAV